MLLASKSQKLLAMIEHGNIFNVLASLFLNYVIVTFCSTLLYGIEGGKILSLSLQIVDWKYWRYLHMKGYLKPEPLECGFICMNGE